jgi:hypothetical protein
MTKDKKTQKLLLAHAKRYPKLQAQDLFKFIFQSSFGCEHLLASPEKAIGYIQSEYEQNPNTSHLIEDLDGDYSRVHLGILSKGMTATTFGLLFCLSAKKEEEGAILLSKKIEACSTLIDEEKLPVLKEDYYAILTEWKNAGFPAIRHSQAFRDNYFPCYRVIANRFIPLLPLFCEIDCFIASSYNAFCKEIDQANNELLPLLKELYKNRLNYFELKNGVLSLTK